MAGYNKKAEPAHPKAESHQHDEGHFREKHLMLDPLPRGQMNDMVMESMYETSWKFWVVFAILSVIVAYGLFFSWGKMLSLIHISEPTRPY